MAINPDTLAAVATQYEAIGITLGELDKRLADIWLNAWADIQQEIAGLADKITREGALRRALAAERALTLLSDAYLNANLEALEATKASLKQIIARAKSDVRRLIETQLPAGESLPSSPTVDRAVTALAERVTGQVTARHYFLQDEATAAMKRELVVGAALGLNPKETASRMVSRAQNVFNGGLNRARVIARTEIIDGYRVAQMVEENRHKDILAGWQWVAELSERTCASCIAMHGSIHPLSEPGPLDHQQGRCTRTPVTKTWKQLGFDGIDEPQAIQPGDGEAWLAKQSEDVQKHVLGVRGVEAWKSGQWPSTRWAQYRVTDGWRDSYMSARPPRFDEAGKPVIAEKTYTPNPNTRPGVVTLPKKGPQPAKHEIATAERIANATGKNVSFREVVVGVNQKNPDVNIDGHIWELKSPKGGGKNTLSHQFERGKKQAPRLGIDFARSSLDEAKSLLEARRRFAGIKELQELILVKKDSSIIWMTK